MQKVEGLGDYFFEKFAYLIQGRSSIKGPWGPGPPQKFGKLQKKYIYAVAWGGGKKEKRSPGPPNNFNPATPL